MFRWLPWVRRRRARLRATPLPEAWRAIVRRNVPLVALRLNDEEQAAHEGLVQLFLHDKVFEGLGGLVMTDEIRVTIAAQACLLLVGLQVDTPYPGLDVIRVYPTSYLARSRRVLPGGAVVEGPSHRLGESSRRGYIVVSWDDVRRGTIDPRDGRNVVLHEFAHQLDAQSGAANGAPLLGEPGLYGPWARVLGGAFAALSAELSRHPVLRAYGATNPAEFFAVATEAFFERPRRLAAEEPELYEMLARYYRQDPATTGR